MELLGYNVECRELGGDENVELEPGFGVEWQTIECGPTKLSVNVPLLPGMRFEARVAGKNICQRRRPDVWRGAEPGAADPAGVAGRGQPHRGDRQLDAGPLDHLTLVHLTLVKRTKPHLNGAVILEPAAGQRHQERGAERPHGPAY